MTSNEKGVKKKLDCPEDSRPVFAQQKCVCPEDVRTSLLVILILTKMKQYIFRGGDPLWGWKSNPPKNTVSRHICEGIGKRECKLLVYQDRKVGAFLHRFIVIKIRKMREYVYRAGSCLICLEFGRIENKFGVVLIIWIWATMSFLGFRKPI